MVFEPKTLDYNISPYTGLTRESWIEAGKYLLTGDSDPFRCFQQTVETCALVIGLWMSKAQIWDTYTREEKDQIAAFLTSYAHANTVPQNWRLFNMLDHAQAILNYSVGDGWYRDGQEESAPVPCCSF